MAIRTFGESIVEFYGEQLVTNTTIAALCIPKGVEEVMVNCAAASRLQIGTKLVACFKTANNEVSFTDYTDAARDRDTSTVVDLSSLSTAANGDYFYVGGKHKFGGMVVDLATANGSASVMTGYYWNGTAWADATITDNTANGGATLTEETATNDSVTWTTPSAWAKKTINGISAYYIRFQFDGALDSDTTIATIALCGDTTNAPAAYLAATTDYVFTLNTEECGALSFTAGSSSTANLTWMRHTKLGNS